MAHDIFILLLGVVLLVAGGNYLTDGAVAVAKRFNVSPLMIGLTVVALGSRHRRVRRGSGQSPHGNSRR